MQFFTFVDIAGEAEPAVVQSDKKRLSLSLDPASTISEFASLCNKPVAQTLLVSWQKLLDTPQNSA
jgi:hypothetical protein